jgi:hypothetical protein
MSELKSVVITYRLTEEDAKLLAESGSLIHQPDPYKKLSIHQIARIACLERIARIKRQQGTS